MRHDPLQDSASDTLPNLSHTLPEMPPTTRSRSSSHASAPQLAASSQTTQGGVLDFSSYPHIADLVIAAAPRASLISLRAASHCMRDLCDARLVRHIVFTERGVETPEGRIPSEDWYERPQVSGAVTKADLQAVPSRPADVDPDACYCPDGAHVCGAELLAPSLPNLNLVRLNGVQADYPILSAPRIQMHVDVVPDSPSAWAAAPGKIVTTACVSDIETVTLLVTYHPEHPLNHLAFYYWLSFPPALRHLVIHYRPRDFLPTPPCPMPTPDPRELERPRILATFANSLCRGTHGGLRYSLVGLDQTWPGMFRPACLQDDPKPFSTELFEAARTEGKRLLGWDDETADECLSRVRFPTLEEYRAELGDDLYQCELEECL